MLYIKSFESFSATQSLTVTDKPDTEVKHFTVSDQMELIGTKLAENLPIFKSFKRSLQKAGAEILDDNPKLLRLFNNKPTFVYQDGTGAFNNDQFKQLTQAVRSHIPYFIQNWNQWVKDYENSRIYNDTPRETRTILLNYNAIIYAVLETDDEELLPFAFVCQMRDFSEYEAEKTLENGIDTFIDMTCTSGANTWTVMSIVKFNSNSNLLLK